MSDAHMQVLLFLTALLSALTGVVAGPRADDSRLAHAQQSLIAVAEAVAPASAAAVRPAPAAPALVRTMLFPTQAPPARPAPLATVKLVE